MKENLIKIWQIGGPLLLSFFCGMAFTLGFGPTGEAFTAMAALVVYVYVLARSHCAVYGALMGWLFGLGWFIPGLSWTYQSMAIHGQLAMPLAAAGVFFLAALLALFHAASAWVATVIQRDTLYRMVFTIPVFFALAEWLRGDGLANFGWIGAGYAFLNSPLAGWASVLGVYGVTFAAVIVAGWVGAIWDLRAKMGAVVTFSIFLGTVVGLGWFWTQIDWSRPGPEVQIRIVQPNLKVSDAFSREDPARRVSDALLLAKGDWPIAQKDLRRLIVLPEGVVNSTLTQLPQSARQSLFNLSLEEKASVLFNGFAEEAPGEFYNASFYVKGGQLVDTLKKRNLVPFGEFIPYGFRWFVDMLGIPMGDLKAGKLIQDNLAVGNTPFSVLICYENLFGSTVRTFWAGWHSPEFIVSTANLGWFADAAAAQYLDMSRMRAIEVARPVINVSNNGLSAVISAKGEVQELMPLNKADVRTIALRGACGDATPFVRFGNLPIAIFLGILALVAVFSAVSTRFQLKNGKI